MGWIGNRWVNSVSDLMGWTPDPLAAAWPGFVLCGECEGTKVCAVCKDDGTSCQGCASQGWCFHCGGAGQWPEDPGDNAYFRPRPPTVRRR